jgi:hypothetical protein
MAFHTFAEGLRIAVIELLELAPGILKVCSDIQMYLYSSVYFQSAPGLCQAYRGFTPGFLYEYPCSSSSIAENRDDAQEANDRGRIAII